MRLRGLDELTEAEGVRGAKGPVAAIIAEDDVEVDATIRHHINLGFKTVLLFAPAELILSPEEEALVIRVDYPTLAEEATLMIVNAVVQALPEKAWLFYCYNAEFLYFPFCETRSVGEMLAFHAEERRFSMMTYVIDLYASDLGQANSAVSLKDAYLDKSGYYALARQSDSGPLERQLDFYGGLRWRFEEHVGEARRRIDRISLIRNRHDITFRADHTWSEAELNTVSCPWHHNLTAAVASFRAAKALHTNPASRFHINTFKWHNSVAFEWHSQQFLDLGLMEPGQWF